MSDIQRLNEISSIDVRGLDNCRIIIDSHDGSGEGAIEIQGKGKSAIETTADGGTLRIEGKKGSTHAAGSATHVSLDGVPLGSGRITSITTGRRSKPIEVTLGSADTEVRMTLPPSKEVEIRGHFGSITATTPMSVRDRIAWLREEAPRKRAKIEEKAARREEKAREKQEKYAAKAERKLAKAERKEERGKESMAQVAKGAALDAAREGEQAFEELMREAKSLREKAKQTEQEMRAEADRLEKSLR